MARKAAQQEEGGLRSQVWLHEAFVDWCNATYDVSLDRMSAAEVIAWFAAKRNEFRQSKDYERAKKAHAAESGAAPRKSAAQKSSAKKTTKGRSKKAAGKKAPAKKSGVRKRAVKKASATDENPFD